LQATRTTIGVQFRTFYDIGSPNLKYLDLFIKSLENFLEKDLDDIDISNHLIFYITTDDPNATIKIASALEKYGGVAFDKAIFKHTGEPVFLNRLLTKLDRLVFQKNSYIEEVDWYTLIPLEWRRRPQYQSISDWYLLGECDLLISTFTSFMATASGRVGHQKPVYKFDPISSSNFERISERNFEL
jgi:hypothetical protein